MLHVISHNDLDGRCSAAIVKKFFENIVVGGECNFFEVDYKDADSFNFSPIQENDTVFIVDFSFKPPKMEELIKRTKRIYWIDHHKTSDVYNFSMGVLGTRQEGDKAACELTWEYMCDLLNIEDRTVPEPVSFIGDRDIMAFKYGDTSERFCEGLKSFNTSPGDSLWDYLLNPAAYKNDYRVKQSIFAAGRTNIAYRKKFCKSFFENYGFFVEVGGGEKKYTVPALNLYKLGAGDVIFGEVFDQYAFCIIFVYSGDKWSVSLFSSKKWAETHNVEQVDVESICKMYGGGGHQFAAGFVCKELPFSKIYYK